MGRYYDDDSPEISDREYDELMMQLKALKSEGIIDYMEIMPSIEEEIAVIHVH